jgi:hypothetical protein
MFTSYELMNKCRMPCSCIYEFINFLVAMFLFIATFPKAERQALLHLCRNARRSGATQGTCHPFILPFSKQKSTTMSQLITRARGFLAGSSVLREVKMAACARLGTAACSMLLAPTPPWLCCEGLRAQSESTGFHQNSFQNALKQPLRLRPKNDFGEKFASYFSNFPEYSRDANAWHP